MVCRHRRIHVFGWFLRLSWVLITVAPRHTRPVFLGASRPRFGLNILVLVEGAVSQRVAITMPPRNRSPVFLRASRPHFDLNILVFSVGGRSVKGCDYYAPP